MGCLFTGLSPQGRSRKARKWGGNSCCGSGPVKNWTGACCAPNTEMKDDAQSAMNQSLLLHSQPVDCISRQGARAVAMHGVRKLERRGCFRRTVRKPEVHLLSRCAEAVKAESRKRAFLPVRGNKRAAWGFRTCSVCKALRAKECCNTARLARVTKSVMIAANGPLLEESCAKPWNLWLQRKQR